MAELVIILTALAPGGGLFIVTCLTAPLTELHPG
jgi:hypothetical protein